MLVVIEHNVLIKLWMEKIFVKNTILVRQREKGLYAQVAAGNLLLVLASWPISYTQDKTRQHLFLFLSFSLFFFSPISYTQDKTRQYSLFLSFFPHFFPFFSKLFLTFAFVCVTLVLKQ